MILSVSDWHYVEVMHAKNRIGFCRMLIINLKLFRLRSLVYGQICIIIPPSSKLKSKLTIFQSKETIKLALPAKWHQILVSNMNKRSEMKRCHISVLILFAILTLGILLTVLLTDSRNSMFQYFIFSMHTWFMI